MPEYLAPGVFVEEIERGPRPIEGVPTSTAAFLGETDRGPLKPTLVTSFGAFLRTFGSTFAPGKYMPDAMRGFFDNGGGRCYVTRIVGEGSQSATATLGNYTVTARGPGEGGNRIFVKLGPGSTRSGPEGNTTPVGFRLQVFAWDSGEAFDPTLEENSRRPLPSVSEDFDDISTDPEHPDYFDRRVNNGNSALITLEVASPNEAIPGQVQDATLTGGENGDAPTVVQYQGTNADPTLRRGLAALELDPYRDVSIVYAPDVSGAPDIVKALVTHAEKMRFRVAVLDAPSSQANVAGLDPRSANDTSYAALYYPWITVSDARTGQRKSVPPGGAVCGIYARSDNTRGVWKAPANEPVRGALELEYDIDQRSQEQLNPRGVNVIRRFPGRGIRVWGARTLSSNSLWRYVSVRRLFIFLESSIYRSTQWVVFEPNDPRLWGRVKQSVTLFLRTQWREGALLGLKEEEAFSVRVGRGETMTEDDILNGRLIVEIGVAPVRPAEFVIFRVFQKTQEATS